jgi:hypothetical protein
MPEQKQVCSHSNYLDAIFPFLIGKKALIIYNCTTQKTQRILIIEAEAINII